MVDVNRDSQLEIGDVEDYRSEGDRKFSHQALVMKAMNKALELGSKELVEGFYDETAKDNKGNPKVIYSEDTRRSFIESVKTCEMVMVCDYDETATTNINEIHTKIKDKRQELLKQQKDFYNQSHHEFKKKFPTDSNFFNTKFSYYNYFIESQINFYREIFKELSLLTKRIGFYEAEEFEA